MKVPKWNGSMQPSTYIFSLVCFFVGFAAITAVSLGRIKHDDREGPGWNPISRMPDGKVGFSEFLIESTGFAVLVFAVMMLWALHGRAA